ncbi:MAG: SDR family NAD(P)-dependent oxidoreductase, partial [Chloroflexi bacterium]|nr:SDR family NAD(P)-dependent oxidoreductase [Chloroflexota bacterium]
MSSDDSNNYEKFDLSRQVAIVTGGGRGTGRAFAEALAEAGASVAVMARTQHELEQTVELIRASGGQAISIQGDVSDSAAVEQVVKTTELDIGPV